MTIQAPIKWSQKPDSLYVVVCVEALRDVELVVEKERMIFRGEGGTDTLGLYECTIEFYDVVKTEKYRTNNTNKMQYEIEIFKQSASWWPRLVKKKGRTPWINIDFHRWIDPELEAEENKNENDGGNKRPKKKVPKKDEKEELDIPAVSDVSDDEQKEAELMEKPPKKTKTLDECKQDVDGILINYCKAGQGPHRILCIPNAPGCWRTDYKRILEEFDHDLFTIIAFDPPGYGRSRPPNRDDWMRPANFSTDEPYNERDAKVGHGLMVELDLLPYSVLGWGDGGVTAINLAYQQRNSANVERLIIWGTSADISEQQIALYRTLTYRDVRKWSERARHPYEVMYSKKYLQTIWTAYLKELLKCYKEKGGDRCLSLLPDVHVPVLIIKGEREVFISKEQLKAIKNALPFAKTAICMNANAWLHLKNLPWFRAQVKRFITEPQSAATLENHKSDGEENEENNAENSELALKNATDHINLEGGNDQWGNWVQ